MKTEPRRSASASCFMLFAVFVSFIHAQDSASNRNEEYFLIRTLEMLYEQWPQDVSNPTAFASAAAELRKDAIRLRVRAERASVDTEIAARLEDFVSLLDSYTNFLTNIGAIRSAARENAGKEEFQSGFKGGYAAAGTFGTLSQNENVTSGEAALASLVVGGITYAVDAWGKSSKRDEAERAAVSAAAQRIQDSFIATLERAKQGFQKVAAMRGWNASEIGWDLSETHAKNVLRMYSEGDLPGLTRETALQRESRPKDPYIRLTHNLFQALGNEKDASMLSRLSEDTYQSISLIPSDPAYDDYKHGAISQAALLASAARDAERRSGASPRSSEASVRALELWNQTLMLQPSDPTGQIRFYRAMALAANGESDKARGEAESVLNLLKTGGEFLYGYACILSLDGDTGRALQALDAALRTGTVDVADVRLDPDLLNLREQKKTEFDALANPQWTWSVVDDWVWDDVILRNDSVYPLTNVVFVVALNKGGKVEKHVLKCDHILPGEKKTSVDIVTGVEGEWDKSSTGELTCDQNKK